jgi:hypothetical protein
MVQISFQSALRMLILLKKTSYGNIPAKSQLYHLKYAIYQSNRAIFAKKKEIGSFLRQNFDVNKLIS